MRDPSAPATNSNKRTCGLRASGTRASGDERGDWASNTEPRRFCFAHPAALGLGTRFRYPKDLSRWDNLPIAWSSRPGPQQIGRRHHGGLSQDDRVSHRRILQRHINCRGCADDRCAGAGGDAGRAAAHSFRAPSVRGRTRQRGGFPRGERRGDEQDDGGYEGRTDRRHRPRFRGDDGATSSGRYRHGADYPALRQKRAAQASCPGDYRYPAAGNRGDEACGRRAAAALLPASTQVPASTIPRPTSGDGMHLDHAR